MHTICRTPIALFTIALLGACVVLGAGSVTIYSTTVNATVSRVTITGTNFSPTGLAPKVAFATTTLGLVSFTNKKVVAALPAGFAAGSYSLTVTNSNSQTGTFAVTLGAVGPTGP